MNFLKVKVQAVNGGKVLVSNGALDPVEVSGKRALFKATKRSWACGRSTCRLRRGRASCTRLLL